MLAADERPAIGRARSDGTAPLARSMMLWMPRASSDPEPRTAIEMGVSCNRSSRFCAVTMISSSTAGWTGSAPWAIPADTPIPAASTEDSIFLCLRGLQLSFRMNQNPLFCLDIFRVASVSVLSVASRQVPAIRASIPSFAVYLPEIPFSCTVDTASYGYSSWMFACLANSTSALLAGEGGTSKSNSGSAPLALAISSIIRADVSRSTPSRLMRCLAGCARRSRVVVLAPRLAIGSEGGDSSGMKIRHPR